MGAITCEQTRPGIRGTDFAALEANAATAYAALGELQEAWAMLARAYKQFEAASRQKGATDHAQTLGVIQSFCGTVLAKQGHPKAIEWLQSALRTKIRELGGEHCEVAKTRCNMGAAFILLDAKPDAVEQLQRAREIQERPDGHGSWSSLAITRFNLSLFAHSEDEAGRLREEASTAFKENGHAYAERMQEQAPLFDWT
jgi:tetratricopeptide (TPR) repeat protein